MNKKILKISLVATILSMVIGNICFAAQNETFQNDIDITKANDGYRKQKAKGEDYRYQTHTVSPTINSLRFTQDDANIYVTYDLTYEDTTLTYSTSTKIGEKFNGISVDGNIYQNSYPGIIFLSDENFTNGLGFYMFEYESYEKANPTSQEVKQTRKEYYIKNGPADEDKFILWTGGDVHNYSAQFIGLDLSGRDNTILRQSDLEQKGLVNVASCSITQTSTNESADHWKWNYKGKITIAKEVYGGDTQTDINVLKCPNVRYLQLISPTAITIEGEGDITQPKTRETNSTQEIPGATGGDTKIKKEINKDYFAYGVYGTAIDLRAVGGDSNENRYVCPTAGHMWNLDTTGMSVDEMKLYHKTKCLDTTAPAPAITADCEWEHYERHIWKDDLYCNNPACNHNHNPEHEWEFFSIDNNNHNQYCWICERDYDLPHNKIYTSVDGAKHLETCADCDYEETVNHTLTYSDQTESSHRASCSECNYNSVVAHSYVSFSSLGSEQHKAVCVCGYEIAEGHSMSGDKCVKCGYETPKKNRGGGGGGGGGGAGGGRAGGGMAKKPAAQQQTTLTKEAYTTNVNFNEIEWYLDTETNITKLRFLSNGNTAKNGFVEINMPAQTDAQGNIIPAHTETYFFNEEKMAKGWVTTADGGKYYFGEDMLNNGKMAVNTWMTIDGNNYYFGADGKMLTNCMTPDGKWVGEDGRNITYM